VAAAPASSDKTLVVVGGGAAGFFCAVNAARLAPSLRVIILEKTSKLLAKVRISGGGRCNLTHALFDLTEMSSRYPRGQRFVKKTFHQFFTTNTIEWFESRGVPVKKEEDGRMFPQSDSSESVVRALMNEANLYGVDIRLNSEVKMIERKEESWNIELRNGNRIQADFVCLSPGGYPKSSMFEWLQNLGHTIAPPVPSLFTFNLAGHSISKLMGLSVEHCRVKIEGSKLVEEGPVLITHWGLSGPAVLKLSAWGARELEQRQYEFAIHVNWLPQYNEQSLKDVFRGLRNVHATKKIINHSIGIPRRLWEYFLNESGIGEEQRFADLPGKDENALIRSLVDSRFTVKGKTTFKEEFVTAGGIDLSEVDANTMMSRKHPKLFFAGEVLDVDGITGGFNFQHAWTSGWIAARAIAATV